ncbi:cysteine hydrolase [Mycobacterium sp. MBM]|nr:cysteine hydrolase [Mycobacterium sp. MBM]
MSDTTILVIDMLNAYRHPDAEQLTTNVAAIVDPLADLVGRGRHRDDVDVVYVNDNHGDFRGDWADIVRAALDGARPDLVRPILPTEDCLRLTKVRHSAFYSTQLDYLLQQTKPGRLILTGQVTEQCVLYTALDAYIRHYDVVVPRDAVAHIDADLGAAACEMMRRNMKAEIVAAADCLP